MSKNIFGKRLSEILEKKGMTQRELANRIGMSKSSVSRFVKGERIPKGSVIVKIADALGTNSDYLLRKHDQKDINKEILYRRKILDKILLPPSLCQDHYNSLENSAALWLGFAQNLMKNKTDRKIIKRMHRYLIAKRHDPFGTKHSNLSINTFLPDSLEDTEKKSFLIQDCYNLPLKSKYTIVELYSHPTSFDDDFTDFFNFFIKCIPLMEELSPYPIMILTRGYISTDTFPTTLFYMDDDDKENGKIKLPVNSILKREHEELAQLGFISINEWCQFETSEAFVWGNQIGLQLKDYITDRVSHE